MFRFLTHKTAMIDPRQALPGRETAIPVTALHRVTGHPLTPPYPDGMSIAVFGMGCFWGAERLFWQTPGAWVTAAGYAGGFTPNPTYEEVCGGRTGHAEVVQVVFDPTRVTYEELLSLFWENHDPTQGMRQGNDVGTQYRSLIGVADESQRIASERSRDLYQRSLTDAGRGQISTEIVQAPVFYFAEPYHQQYLDANPRGYCGLAGTGVSCPIGAGVPTAADSGERAQ